MSEQNPYTLLGVSEDASFDEIQDARNRLVQEHSGDRKLQEALETAYDAILMDRLRMRQEGKIKVPDRIRFPEKLVPPAPKPATAPTQQATAWLQGLVDRPEPKEILSSAALFGGLSIVSLVYPSPDGGILQITMALGVASCLYWLNRKEKKFGKALLLTLAGLIGGLLIGFALAAAVQSLLLGWNISQDTFASAVTFIVLWLVSSFLR